MYPSIRPSNRRLTLGGLPVSLGDWNNLTISPRQWGDKPVMATLDLTFRNIPEDDAAAFITHYHATLSGLLPDSLDPANLSGITEPRLLARMDCDWYYTSPPIVEAVITGIVNLTVQLTADFSPLVTELTAP